MRAGLIGATGLIGQQVLEQLLADPTCTSLKVWARQPAPSAAAAKLDWQCIDFEQLHEQADMSELDVVLCCLGTTTAKAGKAGLEKVDLDYVVCAAQAAKSADVAGFSVISSLGANACAAVHYSRTKGRMEDALCALGFDHLEILRPSLLLGHRQEHRPGEALGQKLAPVFNALLFGPLKRFRAVQAKDVASSMIRFAKSAEPGTHIRYIT
jgi:uncharacterized protein YbjT (DUF2867 family)